MDQDVDPCISFSVGKLCYTDRVHEPPGDAKNVAVSKALLEGVKKGTELLLHEPLALDEGSTDERDDEVQDNEDGDYGDELYVEERTASNGKCKPAREEGG